LFFAFFRFLKNSNLVRVGAGRGAENNQNAGPALGATRGWSWVKSTPWGPEV
jgi:hypothetical protein